MQLESFIRDIPDFPKPGIIFKDITPLLMDAGAFDLTLEQMTRPYANGSVDKIVAIESRGFIFGGAMARRLGCGLVLARKADKLPADTIREEYTLEYGTNALEIHSDSIIENDHVVIVDDLLATGGTALASIRLVERLKGKVVGVEFLIELDFLKGRERISRYPVNSQLHY
ncbi:MAG TPA: adenine phosphoribosyltransferase [Candidatus Aminicenantes bacterium]|mgnify:CR=1 FL=1|nr:adenine phosphoribosyltransferase [Candidatus Aminicenantes bacterium]